MKSSLKEFLTEAPGSKIWLVVNSPDAVRGTVELDDVLVFDSEKSVVAHMLQVMDPDIDDAGIEEEAKKLQPTVKAVNRFISKHQELRMYEDVFIIRVTKVEK